ncbi:MAG: aldo/keto reductase [bacterium]|nr:aldo/keto reductase [bacterium]
MTDFTHTTLGATGMEVQRLGLSASYRPGKKTIHRALDEGINYFFCYGFDTHMTKTLRDLSPSQREKIVIATGAYNLIYWHPDLRKTLEKRLRQLKTDYIDVFMFLGVLKPKEFTPHVQEMLQRFKEEGKVRSIGLSCHDRKFAGQLMADGKIDVGMIRYNAAHRGAEEDIFPHREAHHSGIVSYTATRWGYLLRRPKHYPKTEPIPNAGQCYRFVLSNPNVDVVLTAPRNLKQLNENLIALQQGPLASEEVNFMQKFGDIVRHTKKWFM